MDKFALEIYSDEFVAIENHSDLFLDAPTGPFAVQFDAAFDVVSESLPRKVRSRSNEEV